VAADRHWALQTRRKDGSRVAPGEYVVPVLSVLAPAAGCTRSVARYCRRGDGRIDLLAMACASRGSADSHGGGGAHRLGRRCPNVGTSQTVLALVELATCPRDVPLVPSSSDRRGLTGMAGWLPWRPQFSGSDRSDTPRSYPRSSGGHSPSHNLEPPISAHVRGLRGALRRLWRMVPPPPYPVARAPQTYV